MANEEEIFFLRDVRRNGEIAQDELVKSWRKKKRPALAVQRDGGQRGLPFGKFPAEIHGIFFAVLQLKDDLQIICVETVFFRRGHVAPDPGEGGEVAERGGRVFNVFAGDDARTGGERPFVRAGVNHRPGPAALMERNLHYVARAEIPDLPVAKFPARIRKPVVILRRDGINKILAGAVDKNHVGPHGEGKLCDDSVRAANRGTQRDPARRIRLQPGILQVLLGHGFRHKIRDSQAGEGFHKLLDVGVVRRKFFTGNPPAVRALPLQCEIVAAVIAHPDFGDGRGHAGRGQFEQIRVAEIVHRAMPRRERLRGGRDNGAPAFAFRINLRCAVRRAFPDVDAEGEIRAVTEP